MTEDELHAKAAKWLETLEIRAQSMGYPNSVRNKQIPGYTLTVTFVEHLRPFKYTANGIIATRSEMLNIAKGFGRK